MDTINGNQIDMSQAMRYRKKMKVRAFFSADPITYYKEWGRQVLPAEHYVIIAANGEIYGCAKEEFDDMYEPVPDEPETYRKNTTIRARQLDEMFSVQTITGDGNIEVRKAIGRPGDWLVEDVGGERHIIRQDKFEMLYEAAGE